MIGTVVMSKQKMPFAEAKSCRDAACMFCPCGARVDWRCTAGKMEPVAAVI